VTQEELARRERAARRAETVSIHKGRLGDEQVDFSPVKGAAAISLSTRLTRESFSLARNSAPEYRRDEIPVRFVPRRRR
jgi:hypothetical protein